MFYKFWIPSRFTPRLQIAQEFIKKLDADHKDKYWKYLKKRVHSTQDNLEINFFTHEIYVLGEILFEQENNEKIFLEIVNFLYQESQESKILQNYEKLAKEQKDLIKQKDFLEKQKQIFSG